MTSSNLEIRIRRLQAVILLLVVAVVALTVHAFLPREAAATLRAGAFELLTEDGRVSARLGNEGGQPRLVLLDDDAVERAALFHEQSGTGLFISDSEGTTRIGVAQFSHGGGGIALHGADSRGALVMYLKDTGSIRFFDHDGAVIREIHEENSTEAP